MDLVPRPSRESIYMEMAKLASLRSTCDRLHVGALVSNGDNGKLLSIGYNGSLKGHPHCTHNEECLDKGNCVRAEHAEINALNCLERHYSNLTLFVTAMPCLRCLRRAIEESVRTIYFIKWYNDDSARDRLFLSRHNKELKIIQFIPGITVSEVAYQATIFENGELHESRINRRNSAQS